MYEKLEQEIQKAIDENLESIDEMVFEFVDSDDRSPEGRRYLCNTLTLLANERRRLFSLKDLLDIDAEQKQ